MAEFTIDYFELPVTATATSGAFFEKAFGWSRLDYGPSYTELRDGGTLGGLNSDPKDQSKGPLLGIRTDDIAAAERKVRDAGGTITREIYGFPGGRRFYFREPGGNELMVYQPED